MPKKLTFFYWKIRYGMKSFTMTIKTEAEDAIQALHKIEDHLNGNRDESVNVHFQEITTLDVVVPVEEEEKSSCCGGGCCSSPESGPAPQTEEVRQSGVRPAIGQKVTSGFGNLFAGTSWGK